MQTAAKATLLELVQDHVTSLVREASTAERHNKRSRPLSPSTIVTLSTSTMTTTSTTANQNNTISSPTSKDSTRISCTSDTSTDKDDDFDNNNSACIGSSTSTSTTGSSSAHNIMDKKKDSFKQSNNATPSSSTTTSSSSTTSITTTTTPTTNFIQYVRPRRFIRAEDINLALQWRGSEKLYYSSNTSQAYRAVSDDDDASVNHNDSDTLIDAPPKKKTKKSQSISNKGISSTGTTNRSETRKHDMDTPKQGGQEYIQSGGDADADADEDREISIHNLRHTSTIVDLNQCIRAPHIHRPPSEIGAVMHWLAVDGVQPNIPLNPPLSSNTTNTINTNVILSDHENSTNNNNDNNNQNQITTHAQHAQSIHQTRKYNRMEYGRDVYKDQHNDSDNDSDDNDDEDDNQNNTNKNLRSTGNISVRRLLPRILSEELQLYFSRFTLALERQNPYQQDTALASLAIDRGIQELVPFFARYVGKQIYNNLHDPLNCRIIVRLARAMIANKHLHLELHLHQMLPALLTCVVARNLGTNDDDYDNHNNEQKQIKENHDNSSNLPSVSLTSHHWGLREEAARAVTEACNVYGEEYSTLKARVVRTLFEAITGGLQAIPNKHDGHGNHNNDNNDTNNSIKDNTNNNNNHDQNKHALGSIYGGIFGMTLFGPMAVDAFILPIAGAYWKQWEQELHGFQKATKVDQENNNNNNDNDKIHPTTYPLNLRRRYAIGRVQDAMLGALGVFFSENYHLEHNRRVEYDKLVNVFGERLVPFISCASYDLSEYVTSIV